MDEGLLKVLRQLAKREAGTDVFINLADAEECEDCGWVEAQPGGGYLLTAAGRKTLTENSN